MIISEKDKNYLEKNLKGAKELIEQDELGDLLVLIEDAVVEEEIANDGVLRDPGLLLQAIYERLDEANE